MTFQTAGKHVRLCVHRKGATRALPPGHPDLPEAYRRGGQPVLIPGNMGTGSYVLIGTERAYEETLASACMEVKRTVLRP